jgi:hypothetical protein
MSKAFQMEFIDISRDRTRPPGGGQRIDGFWVYHIDAQTVGQVGYTLNTTSQHIIDQIEEGHFPHAINVGSDSARKRHYRIPRQDVLDYIACRKEGSF